jgi:hypothetical protein
MSIPLKMLVIHRFIHNMRQVIHMLSTKYITDYIIVDVLWWKMEESGEWSA